MKTKLGNYFRASYPGIVINTTEEQRALGEIYAAAKETGKNIFTWSATEGLSQATPDIRTFQDTNELLPAMQTIREMRGLENSIMILRDLSAWPFDRDPFHARGLRDLLAWAPGTGSCVVIVQPDFKPYPAIEKMVTMLDFALPDAAARLAIAQGIAGSAGIQFNGDGAELVRAMAGLSTTEAENALALSLIETGKLDPAIIYREKIAGVKKSGLLEIIEPEPAGLDSIGGMDILKTYILKRKDTFSTDAVKYGLPDSKGIVLVSPPGCGKSLAARCIGTALTLPTLKLDLGRLFNSLVGETERQTREALRLAEALSPCVLWIDEIEKGLAGSSGSGANDSGVSRRMFGTLLTWLQERRGTIYLVATANNVRTLDPESLRKGRIDEMFAIDLPTPEERLAIFRIHLGKRGRKSLADTLDKLSAPISATDGFTGAEIEAVIIESLFNGFADGRREITADDLVSAAKGTVPLSQSAKEKIEDIRTWAKTNARPASSSIQDLSISQTRRIYR